MEKYAVMLDQEKVKTADTLSQARCPSCGSSVSSSFPHCSNCGTKPFEKQTWATESTNRLEK